MGIKDTCIDYAFDLERRPPGHASREQEMLHREMWYRRCLSRNLPALRINEDEDLDLEHTGTSFSSLRADSYKNATSGGKHQFLSKRQSYERELELGLISALLRRSLNRQHRKRLLGALLAVAVIAFVTLNFMTCRFFICASVRVTPQGRYIDLKDLFSESYLLRRQDDGPRAHASPAARPLLIPRIIHQTYGSRKLPEGLQKLQTSWKTVNGASWAMRMYDDAECLDFVQREFPEYTDAYLALPKDIERSDFFRYLVVLRYGGIYADVDVESKQPLDNLIRPDDTMIVGWEVEVPNDETAAHFHYARKRQLLQWFFAAAPGHPALRAVCDKVASQALMVFSNNTNQDTLERTGPGVWTDVVLKYALDHPAAEVRNPWKVRIMPRISFGLPTDGVEGMDPNSKEVVVLHHYMGSWKKKRGWNKQRTLTQIVGDLWQKFNKRQSSGNLEEPIRDPLGAKHFPVSVNWEPPFSMMVNLVGHGDTQWDEDISHTISNWGSWQASLSPSRHPAVADALIGSLGGKDKGTTLVDIGAGQGFFSLAAAARGHRALAFETSQNSLAALKFSMRYNGFEPLITVHSAPLGATPGQVCIRRSTAESASDSADVEIQRGYGPWGVHSANGTACGEVAVRVQLGPQLPTDGSVGAMRLSANGWEDAILEGAEAWMAAHPPGVVLVELSPRMMKRAGNHAPLRLLQKMVSLGYDNIAHAGPRCDQRWINMTEPLQPGASWGSHVPSHMPQPTWCKMQPQQFSILTNLTHSAAPENVLFIHKSYGVVSGGGAVEY